MNNTVPEFISKSIMNHWLALQCDWLSACDLLTNRTIFYSKSHLFLSQWEWDSKTKQPIRFRSFFKLTNHITGKWKKKSHCLANLAIKLCDFKMDLIKWQLNFGSCNFGLKLYLWIQIELALLVRFWNQAYDFRPNCTPLSSFTITNLSIVYQIKNK